MSNLKNKFVMLLATFLFSFSFINPVFSQGEGELVAVSIVNSQDHETGLYETESPVINQGIEAAETGVDYWTAEKENANTYCTPETKTICLNMEARCNNQVTAWTTEAGNQVRIGQSYIIHSASYWAAKRYLGWAIRAREGLKALYDRTGLPQVKLLLDGLDKAIEYAQKILSLFE